MLFSGYYFNIIKGFLYITFYVIIITILKPVVKIPDKLISLHFLKLQKDPQCNFRKVEIYSQK